ncbi:hypothetical protein HYT51_00725 [Candidatus Woesearchaeota archaeon]|nr:hypothetical protein [Candidatus Woesearchaeota archaeon]
MENTIRLEDVYRELKKIEQAMITKAEMNNMIETIAILSNKDTMKQIIASEKNIKLGKVKKINSINDI